MLMFTNVHVCSLRRHLKMEMISSLQEDSKLKSSLLVLQDQRSRNKLIYPSLSQCWDQPCFIKYEYQLWMKWDHLPNNKNWLLIIPWQPMNQFLCNIYLSGTNASSAQNQTFFKDMIFKMHINQFKKSSYSSRWMKSEKRQTSDLLLKPLYRK